MVVDKALLGFLVAVLAILFCVFGMPGVFESLGVNPDAGKDEGDTGVTVFSDETRTLQGQSREVQDTIALTQNAVAVCTELNNCFAPEGYTESSNLSAVFGIGLVIGIFAVLGVLLWLAAKKGA